MRDLLDETIEVMVHENLHFAEALHLVQFSEARRVFEERKESEG